MAVEAVFYKDKMRKWILENVFMMKQIFYVSLLCVVLPSCNRKSRLEYALEFAGANRAALEKVLHHYAQDTLKYKAACFLIENMPYYYSYRSDQLSHYHRELYPAAVEMGYDGVEALNRLAGRYGQFDATQLKVVYDAHVITSGYLIKNIEQSFKVWREKSWNSQLRFEDFCEQLLPYRIKTEPLEDWRDLYYSEFQPILDSLPVAPGSPLAAVEALYDAMNSKRWVMLDNPPALYPFPGAATLLSNRIGSCYELAHLGAYVMRAVGIPGGIDGYLQYPYGAGIHRWNFILDNKGNTWEFSMNAYRPRPAKRESPFMGRVFRQCFGVQAQSLPIATGMRKDLPPLLNSAFIKDVSEQYLHNSSLYVKVDTHEKKDNLLYLCTFGFKSWVPVAWSQWKDGIFAFHSLERGMLYLPAYYISGKVVPAGAPCSVNADGTHTFVPFWEGDRQTLRLSRKYPARWVWDRYNRRILNGKLQVSDNPEFSNAVTLHTVTKESDMSWSVAVSADTQRYRYARYLSGDDGHCNMAELEFYSENGAKLRGSVIGTPGSYLNQSSSAKEAVFDGNPLTFFDANEANGAWAGLDFGRPERISKVLYLFRNDDNGIRQGDVYELFYWNNTAWISLGSQAGENAPLEFANCPEYALFWLHNQTRGSEERPFFYVDEQQMFWGKPM